MIDAADYRVSPSAALEEIDELAGALVELATLVDEHPGLIPAPISRLALRVAARPSVARRLRPEGAVA